MLELNCIIDTIALAHKIQKSKHYTPYFDTAIKHRQHLHKTAIDTDTPEDWRLFRHFRNTLNKHLDTLKRIYYYNRFNNAYNFDTDMWQTLKSVTNTNKQQTPKNIIHNNTLVTSPAQLAHIANTHYVNKINTLRNTFKALTLNPIHILSALIPHTQHTFTLPYITIEETIKIITSAKSSHSTGHDNISMHILKKISHIIAPHITHLINT